MVRHGHGRVQARSRSQSSCAEHVNPVDGCGRRQPRGAVLLPSPQPPPLRRSRRRWRSAARRRARRRTKHASGASSRDTRAPVRRCAPAGLPSVSGRDAVHAPPTSRRPPCSPAAPWLRPSLGSGRRGRGETFDAEPASREAREAAHASAARDDLRGEGDVAAPGKGHGGARRRLGTGRGRGWRARRRSRVSARVEVEGGGRGCREEGRGRPVADGQAADTLIGAVGAVARRRGLPAALGCPHTPRRWGGPAGSEPAAAGSGVGLAFFGAGSRFGVPSATGHVSSSPSSSRPPQKTHGRRRRRSTARVAGGGGAARRRQRPPPRALERRRLGSAASGSAACARGRAERSRTSPKSPLVCSASSHQTSGWRSRLAAVSRGRRAA